VNHPVNGRKNTASGGWRQEFRQISVSNSVDCWFPFGCTGIEHPKNFIASSDRQLLDAYSKHHHGCSANAPAVAHIHVVKKTKSRTGKPVEMPGSGSGFVISTDVMWLPISCN